MSSSGYGRRGQIGYARRTRSTLPAALGTVDERAPESGSQAFHPRASDVGVHRRRDRGCRSHRPLPPDTVAEIRAALLEWKVVFFRGQSLDHAQHVAFARYFGDPTPGHVVFGGDSVYPEIYSVAKHRVANSAVGEPHIRAWTGWHTDITAALNPPAASILRGVTVPPYGGDTLWTNLAVAYRDLSAPMQRFVEGLRGVHRFEDERDGKMSREYEERVSRSRLESEHPLVRVHPESGEKVLFVSPGFLRSIVGLAPRESQALLELLWEHVCAPRVHGALSVGAGQHRVLGQPRHRAPRPARHLRHGLRSGSSTVSPSSATCRGVSTGANRRRSRVLRSWRSEPRPSTVGR